MQLGIFAKTFPRPTLTATLAAVVEHDLRCIQFNMACAGLPALPDSIPQRVVAAIRAEVTERDIAIAAISGTFNMAHPDPQVRATGLRRLAVLAGVCQEVGTHIITLCTGTRDPDDMWRWHTDNTTPETWQTMLTTIRAAVAIAENAGVTLAFEPERANVVYSAPKARELLTAVGSPALKVVLDPANIIDGRDPAAIPAVLDEAFALLGDDIVLAHAKDKGADDGFLAAGLGVLDYPRYLRLLDSSGFDGALVIHGLTEDAVDDSVRFVRATYTAATGKALD